MLRVVSPAPLAPRAPAAVARPRSALRFAGVLGLVHALVDATTVTAVFRALPAQALAAVDAFTLVLAYDTLAFGAQAALGLLVDARRASRAAAVLGVTLSACALSLADVSALATVAAAGLGNALFHVGAGAVVLERSEGRSAPAGVFVAPGALGLALGLHLGRSPTLPAWPLAALCLVALLAVVMAPALASADAAPAGSSPRRAPAGALAAAAVILLCLGSVAVRSFVGFAAPRPCPGGPLFLLGIPLAGFGGKLAGGFLADRLGRLRTGVGALVASAPLLALGAEEPLLVLPGLLLFQLTMPVTLVTVAEALPRRPALAFGLPCLALVGGALPTFFDAGLRYAPAALLALVLASAAALGQALRLAGKPAVPA